MIGTGLSSNIERVSRFEGEMGLNPSDNRGYRAGIWTQIKGFIDLIKVHPNGVSQNAPTTG